MPISSRPLEMWSMVTASAARMDGCRYVTPVTRTPSRIREVFAASPASSVQPSMHGPFGLP